MKFETYPLEQYPQSEHAEFPPELEIAYAVCARECGNREFIVDGSTQVCQRCGKLMFRTASQKYVAARTTARESKGTTTLGTVNRNGQLVVQRTELPGNDHLQKLYVVRCTHCDHEYGANGSDLFQRKCPACQGGAPGLPF